MDDATILHRRFKRGMYWFGNQANHDHKDYSHLKQKFNAEVIQPLDRILSKRLDELDEADRQSIALSKRILKGTITGIYKK